ncbi:NAD-dependent succinate-semialdehyde dehydrogenase [Brevibacillus massiliensis]|jgi:succinate-semialdehyde dehydrogenase/glutarate-semialdehyde dehydrogenase|uniref:NAD-dependent succinate-semialdehyde dehydrogenase n=1 Tax=Brevibacillus massiliensis TaxID=1118054 RepID=UPI0002E2B41C|nr:NAD-dependent succinate-semialdehyde dehydrogenase [Brevibacillus massiliensis]
MLYINGEWCQAQSGKTFEVTNPATGETIATVAKGGAADTQAAIDAAQAAFPAWARLTAKERYTYLKNTADILRGRVDEIAALITREMGKPLAESKGEIGLAIDYLDWYAEEGKRIYGDTIPASSPSKRIIVTRQPVGVVGAITPWNFPIAMITRKLAPALAAGCTIILKAASATPLAAIEVFKALHEAGLPKGVANLVNGSAAEVVGAMMASPVVRKITFTGSTEVGKELVRQSADTMKKVSMELGGHAPFIVFEDADLEKAAEGAIASKFRNAGQTCICTNRIYVQKSVAEKFAAIMAEKVSRLVVGNGLEEGVNIGPMIDRQAVEKAQEHIDDAVSKGAKVVCGGSKLEQGAYANGCFFEPTVLLNATHEMKISYEETFGPVAPIFTFETEEEAIRRANDTVYGLASYVFTKDGSRMFRVAEALDYGIVGINDPVPTVAQAPFGGVKESGVGREGGKYGIEDYLDYKFMSFQLEM